VADELSKEPVRTFSSKEAPQQIGGSSQDAANAKSCADCGFKCIEGCT
jgi:hypothetical protein